MWKYKGAESILSGPAESGKTFGLLQLLDARLWKYPRCQAMMLRKTRDSIHSTCLETYRKIIGEGSPIKPYGGERPVWFDYPNGSRLWLGGMDDPQKVLSAERDFVYINQAEEFSLTDWEFVLTRCTGRAGNAPYAQLFGDCNPGPPHHWIKKRETLKLFDSRHEDNPTLYDDVTKQWTEQGRRTLEVLDSLTGVRKERLRFGRWVSAEGVVYEAIPGTHIIDKFDVPATWTRFRSADFGYTNPFVLQWWCLDPDGRMILYREIYMTERTVRVHAMRAIELSHGESYIGTVADWDAEGRATLDECGIRTVQAVKDIQENIDAVRERMKIAKDGKPRLMVMCGALVERDENLEARRLPTCTEQEFDVYQYPKGTDGKPTKEVPLDRDNHGMDALGYAVRFADAWLRRGPGCGVYIPPVGKRARNPLDDMPPDVWK